MTRRHEMPTPGAAAQIAACFRALVPVLTTERLTLRGPQLGDFDVFAEILCSDRSIHMGGPLERDEAWTTFAAMTASWTLHGHGPWTIEDAATCEVLGFVLLGLEPGDHEVELGFFLTRAAEGKGIAAGAATAVRDWARSELGLTGLVSYVSPGNARSARLAERMGATRDAEAEVAFDEPLHVFRHPDEGRTLSGTIGASR